MTLLPTDPSFTLQLSLWIFTIRYSTILTCLILFKYLSQILNILLIDCKLLPGIDYVFLAQLYPPATLYSAWHKGEAYQIYVE